MLEIRNVTKIYRSKTGETVKALDDISLSFPETGMVFILGKSGSGKSTLLNVIGGLDGYDSGEFVIKGKSSKQFAGSDFDAYRNTFIGFIFQEYNILDDFTVGANIGLALELQGKKATNERINEILASVDLSGYAHRKPNELSGGQKQRVAIARALVKDPQIIMADEPTGALDSNTGKAIFDTLKALSREKLVLIVSHDRDFAERYADRIIELKDGRVLSDVTKHEQEGERLNHGISRMGDRLLRIKGGYQLTPADVEMINSYLRENSEGLILSGDEKVNSELRTAAGITEDGGTASFSATRHGTDYTVKQYDGKATGFIRSRLPMKNAIRIGGSSLKHKRFRLVMTVLLSLISFAMFGLADTMAAYEKLSAATASILDSNVRYASVTVGVRHTTQWGDDDPYTYYQEAGINEEDLAHLIAETGLEFVPVFTGSRYMYDGGFNISRLMQNYSNNNVYTGEISGMTTVTEKLLQTADFKMVAGRLPAAKGEVVITEFLVRQFAQYGFENTAHEEVLKKNEVTAESMLGKHLTFENIGYINLGSTVSYEIVGVLDTNFDYARYEEFLPREDGIVLDQDLMDMLRLQELQFERDYSFHALCFAMQEDIQALANKTQYNFKELGVYMSGGNKNLCLVISRPPENAIDDPMDVISLDMVGNASVLEELNVIEWLDGERTELGENEILIPKSALDQILPSSARIDPAKTGFAEFAKALFGEDIWNTTNTESSYFERFRQAAPRAYIREMLQDPDVYAVVQREAANWFGYDILKPDDFEESIKSTDSYVENTTRMDPESYWNYMWFETYQTGYAPSMEGREFLNRYEVEEKIHEMPEWQDFIESFYGMDLPTLSKSSVSAFFSIFWNVYDDAEMCGDISRWTISQALRNIFCREIVVSNRLWENDDYVNALLKDYSIKRSEWLQYSEENKIDTMVNFYSGRYGYDQENAYMIYDLNEIDEKAGEIFYSITGMEIKDMLAELLFRLDEREYSSGFPTEKTLKQSDYKIVGVFDTPDDPYRYSGMVISDDIYNYYSEWQEDNKIIFEGDINNDYKEDIAEHKDGIWAFVLAPLSVRNTEAVRKLVEMSYAEGVELRYEMNNAVMYTLGSFNDMIEVMAQVFVWVGLGFAVFSAFLLMNFISISISYKKREIGILRAVGARSSDVFKIFFSESLMIALINFLLATLACAGSIIALNVYMRNAGVNITLLNFGIRQILLMLGVSALVALLASFLPVYRIARKKPVDAIKDR